MNATSTTSRNASTSCPLCGNDRIVRVTRFTDGQPDQKRAICAGSLGCEAWFDPDTRAVVRTGWDDLRKQA